MRDKFFQTCHLTGCIFLGKVLLRNSTFLRLQISGVPFVVVFFCLSARRAPFSCRPAISEIVVHMQRKVAVASVPNWTLVFAATDSDSE